MRIQDNKVEPQLVTILIFSIIPIKIEDLPLPQIN